MAAIGVPKQERDPLGRWSPGGCEDYVRTYRAVVKRLVGKFVSAARSPTAFDDLDEADAIDDAQRVAVLRGPSWERTSLVSWSSPGGSSAGNPEFKVFEEYIPEDLRIEVEDGPVLEAAPPTPAAAPTAPNLARRGRQTGWTRGTTRTSSWAQSS